jgi:type IV pilus assembly protein PilW
MKLQSLRLLERRFGKGLTLIEMMVSITIGLLIMVAIVAIYSGSLGASRTAEAQGRMNEDAQAALTILTQQIRMAGANPKQPNRTAAFPRNPVFTVGTTYALRGCDGTFANINSAAYTTPQSLATCGTSTLPDSLVLSYEADLFNTVRTSGATPVSTDCLGSGLTTVSGTATVVSGPGTTSVQAVTYTVADNRFYIGTSTVVTSPSLYCKGSATTNQQPLVENIEDLQFTYGTAPAVAGTATVAGYLTAQQVETDTNVDSTGIALSTLATSQARWDRVTTVRICVLVRSELPVATAGADSVKYINCDGNLTTPSDQRLRKAYYTTVVLRNRLP